MRFVIASALCFACRFTASVAGADPAIASDLKASQSASPISRYDRAILLYERNDNKDVILWLNGFVVSRDEQLFIVTESARCRRLSKEARIGIVDTPDVKWVALSDICEFGLADSRVYDQEAHTAVIPVGSHVKESIRDNLRAIAISFNNLALRVPPRSTRVDIVGYGWSGQSDLARLQSLVLPSYVASRELTKSDIEIAPVFLTSPSAKSAILGGPVFTHHDDETAVGCVGMYLTEFVLLNEQTTGTVVPAHVIAQLIIKAADGSDVVR